MSIKSLLDFSHANSSNNIRVNDLIIDGDLSLENPVKYNFSSVTQLTSISTAVTCDAVLGRVETVNTTLAANSTVAFTVNCDKIVSSQNIIMSLENYSGTYITNGMPIIEVGNVALGSFTVHLTNIHPSNALSGVITLIFNVVSRN